MVIHDVVQGTEEWLNLRLATPTASNFYRILAKPRKNGEGVREGYLKDLINEYFTRISTKVFQTEYMRRGKKLEPEAIFEFTFRTGINVKRVGFVTNDTETVGCSPDGFAGTDGLIEVKAPTPSNQMSWIEKGGIPGKHKAQVQGGLMVCERDKGYFWSYCPGLAHEYFGYLVEVGRDETYIMSLREEIDRFNEDLHNRIYHMETGGYREREPPVENKVDKRPSL